MWRRFFTAFATILTALLWLMQPTVAQNITNVTVESVICSSVNVSAKVDPVSSTYTFSWIVSSRNGPDIHIVLVGLNGEGNVETLDLNSSFNYFIENKPNFLPNLNNPFESILTFNFGDNESNTDLVFGVVSTPLDIRINGRVSQPRCPNFNVSCIDSSQDCFLCGSNVSAVITCLNNESFTSTCSENATFMFDECPAVVSTIPTGSATAQPLPTTLFTNTNASTDAVTVTMSPVTRPESQQFTTTERLTQFTTEQRTDVSSTVTSNMTTTKTLQTTVIAIEDSTLSSTEVTTTMLAVTDAERRCPPIEDLSYVSSCFNSNAVGSFCKLNCALGQNIQTKYYKNGAIPIVIFCLDNGEWSVSLSLLDENCQEELQQSQTTDPLFQSTTEQRTTAISDVATTETLETATITTEDTTTSTFAVTTTMFPVTTTGNDQFNKCFGTCSPYRKCDRIICHLYCPPGYTILGPNLILNYVGVRITSKCCLKYEIRCSELEKSNYVGTCSNKNRVGSICRLSCNPGQYLRTRPIVMCLKSGWYPRLERVEDCRNDNSQLSICFRISSPSLKCQCDWLGRYCYLSCSRGYTLVGPNWIPNHFGVRITSYCSRNYAHGSYLFYG